MLFNSFEFLIFFAVFSLGWPFVRGRDRLRWGYIIAFSLFFYGWWDWKYVPLMVGTIFIDYFAALMMDRPQANRRFWLVMSIISNLTILGYFKYSYFILSNSDSILKLLGFDVEIGQNNLILPLGISFYTFQSMSYTIGVYRRAIPATRHVMHFYSAVTFFPHLVAGPILRAGDILPQLLTWRRPGWWEWWLALRLIADGFFRKVVIADNLAGTVNDAFAGRAGDMTSTEWWIVVTMFAFQIYFDFSGYSNIARGLAQFYGYHFMLNFDFPYFSKSLREFWTRWHISLSSWFRDYVYIPLGGSRGGVAATVRNVMLTFTLSGLWHGAGWTFIVWGALHGFLLGVERLTDWPARLAAIPAGRFLAWAVIIVQVWIAWVFFRAENIDQAFHIIGRMFAFDGLAVDLSRTALIYLGLGAIYDAYARVGYPDADAREIVTRREMIATAMILVACVFLRGPGQEFVYFQF